MLRKETIQKVLESNNIHDENLVNALYLLFQQSELKTEIAKEVIKYIDSERRKRNIAKGIPHTRSVLVD